MAVLSGLQNISDDGGNLLSVSEFRFEGDPKFVCRYCLVFESVESNFVIDSEFDTVDCVIGSVTNDPDLEKVNVSDQNPWSHAIGARLVWGWSLVNTQGYNDGFRLEFGPIDAPVIVEFIVTASAFSLYLPTLQTKTN